MSDSRSPLDPRAEELFCDFLVRQDAGERVDFDALCRAHPDLEPDLRSVRRAFDAFERIRPSQTRGPAIAERIKAKHGAGIDPTISLDEQPKGDAKPSSRLLQKLRADASRGSRYMLLAEVARGGMGAILKVWDDELRRHLAMKVVLGKGERTTGDTPSVDPKTLGRFLEEAQITSQLDHPGIVPVHELGLDSTGRVYFTMRLVKGEDLRAIFEHVKTAHDGWNQVRALNVLLRVCEAMSYAHSKGVIHRDLKPANVMVGKFGEVYVMDWGLARVLGRDDKHDLRIEPRASSAPSVVKTDRREDGAVTPDSPLITMDGDVVGTPSFMSPEQARGELERLGPRSDVYSIGAMLYQLVTGEMPFVPAGVRVTQYAILMRLLEGPPKNALELAPEAPTELLAICEKAMARESADRYADTVQLAADLRAYLEGRVVAAYETGAWAETKKWMQRNKALASSIAAALLIAVAGVFAFAFQSAEAQRFAERERRAAEVARDNEQRAREAETRANEERAWADKIALEARQNAYHATVIGAQAALNVNEMPTVRRLLDSAPEELRNWEWNYFNAVSDTSLLKLDGYTANWSPDGTRIVTASSGNTARVWDAQTGKEVEQLVGHRNPVTCATFSPDGTQIVTASENDDSVRLWDAQSGRQLARFEASRVKSANFSPDGKRIVAQSLNASVWDAQLDPQLALPTWFLDSAHSTSFSPDSTRIITVPRDGTARVWDAQSHQEIAILRRHAIEVRLAIFSPDSSRIVTASEDGTVRVWDAQSGQEVAVHNENAGWVSFATFSPDATRILSVSNGRPDPARVWDAQTGRELARFGGSTDRVNSATFSPDGSRIVTGGEDGIARVWDAQSGEELAMLLGHMRPITFAGFSLDGMRIVTASEDKSVRVWDALSVQSTFVFKEVGSQAFFAKFSPDGTRIVTSGGKTARVWDALSGGQLVNLDGHANRVDSVNFSPDGTRIVTVWDDMARLWDALTGQELGQLRGHTNRVCSANFSFDCTRIVTASDDKSARVWDALTGRELVKLEGHTAGLNSATFSPDGVHIVTSANDGTARVWDAQTGEENAKLQGHTDVVKFATFAPDGLRIVTASWDETIRVWNARTGEQLAMSTGYTGVHVSASFSPDGSRIINSAFKSARVWDAQLGRELAKFDSGKIPIHSASFSADGTRIVIAWGDGTVRVLDSVPFRVRRAELQALVAARPAGERSLAAALVRSTDFGAAAALLRDDETLDPFVRRAALNSLSERCNAALENANALEHMRAEGVWIAHMLGLRQWRSESDAETELRTEEDLPTEAFSLFSLARTLVDPDGVLGDAPRALVVARRAVAAAEAEAPFYGLTRMAILSQSRDTLARALFRLGRFDEALTEQRLALQEAPESERARFQQYLDDLECDIADWRDESGQIQVAKWTAKLESLNQEIAARETDPDVRMWLAGKR